MRIEHIYIPTGRRKEMNQEKVDVVAEKIIGEIPHPPIHVRKGKGRYVLVSGIHRLEARKALGEEIIEVIIVGARLF